jgi:hypothetical protein
MLARLAKEQLQADNEVEAGKRQFKVARSHLQTFKVRAPFSPPSSAFAS